MTEAMKKSSWAKVGKKITPTARISAASKKSRDEQPKSHIDIAREQLSKNFYLDDGVAKWELVYPIARGERQSPIDIDTTKTQRDNSLQSLNPKYEADCCKSVVNTGNSFMVEVDDKKTSLTGGCLDETYQLIQFHAHWGTKAGAKGSEHTVDGKLYDAELHLVHWNTKYGLFSKAISEPDGLAVVGIFLQIGENDHPELEKVFHVFDKIQHKGLRVPYEIEIQPEKFLPKTRSYWNYPGSLTTPPLDESVLWHVMRTPVTISKRQFDKMASLRIGTSTEDPIDCCMVNNFRPPQPLGAKRGPVKLFDDDASCSQEE